MLKSTRVRSSRSISWFQVVKQIMAVNLQQNLLLTIEIWQEVDPHIVQEKVLPYNFIILFFTNK